MTVLGCGKGSDSGASSESSSCQPQSSAHTGCCSSHGGFGDGCDPGEALYTSGGRLVCNDGSLSPSCGYSKIEFLDLIQEDASESDDSIK